MKRLNTALLLVFLTNISFAQIISADSLVLLLPFNGNANDQSGNTYHGVVNGATLTTGADNQPNSAYYFDGVSNSITIPDIKKLDGTLRAFTILIRMQPHDVRADPTVQPPYGTSYNFLTWHRHKADSLQAFWSSKMRTAWQGPSAGTEPGKAFLGYIMDWCNIAGTASGYQKDSGLVNRQWHTVAYVYNSGTMRIYHNCKLENDWNVYPAKSEICGTEPVQITLGTVPQAVMQYGYRNFKGKIDELRVYTRALSETEVKLFADTLCKTPPPPFQPQIHVTADPCYPNRFLLQDKSDTAGRGFQGRSWSLSTGDTAAVDSFTYSFAQPGTYKVRLRVYTASGVHDKDTSLVVSVVGARKFLSYHRLAESVCAGQQFWPQLSGGTAYQWQPCFYLSDCAVANPLISAPESVRYTVIGTDNLGCKDTAVVNLAVVTDSLVVYVPTAFSPNRDGRNEGFGVANAQPLTDFRMQVFNRWGQLVFQTADPFQKWNGRLKGNPAPAGVYVWMLRYKNGTGCGQKQQTGTVVLLR